MLIKDKIVNILKKEYPFLRDKYQVSAIGVFGSIAKGEAKANSDVDIFMRFYKSPGLAFMSLANYLERKLGRKIDIITPMGLKSIRSKAIVRDIEKHMIYV